MMDRNCICFCYVTMQIILIPLSTNIKLTSIFLGLFQVNLLNSVIEHGNLLKTAISQCGVATWLRCGRMFNNNFIANLLVSPSVKEFWKSQNLLWLLSQCHVIILLKSYTVSAVLALVLWIYRQYVKMQQDLQKNVLLLSENMQRISETPVHRHLSLDFLWLICPLYILHKLMPVKQYQ